MLRVLHSWGSSGNFRSKQAYQFFSYFIVAIVALAADFFVLELMVRVLGFSVVLAAIPAFFVGAFVNYSLSIRFVFSERRLMSKKVLEFTVFMVVGLLGLAITQLVLHVGVEVLSVNLEVVKTLAAGATFASNFLIRKFALFS